MRLLKILHTSDIHLDHVLTDYGRDCRNVRRAELVSAFDFLVDEAVRQAPTSCDSGRPLSACPFRFHRVRCTRGFPQARPSLDFRRRVLEKPRMHSWPCSPSV